ncbi:MAG: transcription termination factor NusA [Candidatus Moranbacteria bacterium]|nr:transcription termination factor NusA [Candidatus Moranbacteria bacterium]
MSNNGKVIKDSSALGQFQAAISQICEEKGLNKESVVDTIEAALAAAYKKDYGKKGQIIVSHMEPNTGTVKFKQLKEVVDENVRNLEGLEEEEFKDEEFVGNASKSKEEIASRSVQMMEEGAEHLPKFNSQKDILLEEAKKVNKNIKVGDFLEMDLEAKGEYGRVASQTAKQVIIQRLREAERTAMYQEYKSKEGEIINGTVHRFEGRNVFVDLGKSIGVLYPSEQIPGEFYRIGQRLRVYIEKVEEDAKGPGVLLSRTSEGLVKKLFELEVPEIFTGTIEIKGIAREASSRTKIAVVSHEEGIDPVGSCVGQKGTRVQAIIEELGGERIDIISWNEKAEKLIASALSPAKVVKVELDEKKKEANAFVAQEQLSLAIGHRGQNVRLAAKLTGWKINVVVLESGEKKAEAKASGEVKQEEGEKKPSNKKDKEEKSSEDEGEGK